MRRFQLSVAPVLRPHPLLRALPVLLAFWAAALAAAQKPNILLLFTDDQGYHDLSCQGATDFTTPNIDRIAHEGVRFTAGYVTAPQCAPSRGGLMTGISQARFGFTDNNHDPGLPPREVLETIPEQLRALGYATGMIGKWHIGYGREPGDNTKKVLIPGNQPWERGFDYTLMFPGGGMHFFPYDGSEMAARYATRDHPFGPLMLKADPATELVPVRGLPPDTYLTTYFSEQAVEFVERNDGKPWFLFVSYNAPHVPCMAPERNLAKFEHIEDPKRRMLAAMMDSVDEGIGMILDALDETGQADNTIVWFLSDNGGPTTKNGSRNDPFSGFKGDVHEGGIRVPFLLRWPERIAAGKVVDDPVISLDILPTSVMAAGARSVAPIHEGADLAPWLAGDAEAPERTLYWSWRGGYHAVRIGDLKETRNKGDEVSVDGERVPEHLFTNIVTNPKELPQGALEDPAKERMLADALDAWLEQVRTDAERLTPGQ